MQPDSFRYPLLNLPPQIEQVIYLIREELKSRKFFHTLNKVGLDDCNFRPNLDSLILRGLGLDSSDETFDVYTRIMDKRSKKIEANWECITKQALKVYHELLIEKERLKRQ